jgi:hypothetical protein
VLLDADALNKLTDVCLFFSLLPYLAHMKILAKIILPDNHGITAVSRDQEAPPVNNHLF